MKALITAIGVGAFLIAPTGAYAANFVWDGGNSRAWQNQFNWTADSGAPGGSPSDTALIDDNPIGNQPQYGNLAGNRTIAQLTVDSDANSVDVLLDIIGDDNFTVTGTTTIFADAADGSANYDATITLDADAAMDFDPGDFVLDGGNPNETFHGLALFVNNAGTLVPPNSVTMRGDSKIDSTLDVSVDGSLIIDADGFATEAVISMADSGDDFRAASLLIGDDTYTCKLTFSGSGSFETN